MQPIKCPKCFNDNAELLKHEVDIGVGVQEFVYGLECPDCGQIGCCTSCGKWDFEPHSQWCNELKRI